MRCWTLAQRAAIRGWRLSDADGLSEQRESLQAGIAAMKFGNRLTDVAHAISGTRRAFRYGRSFGIVADLRGATSAASAYGSVLAERCAGARSLLAAGSVLAIEPMLTLSTTKTVVLDDRNGPDTTADGSRAAQEFLR